MPALSSQIDITQPTPARPTTASVRENFKRARDEINQLFAGEGSPAGRDLVAASNLADLTNKPEARLNLGLGSAATRNFTAFDMAGAAAAAALAGQAAANNALAQAKAYTDAHSGGGGGGGGGSTDDAITLSSWVL